MQVIAAVPRMLFATGIALAAAATLAAEAPHPPEVVVEGMDRAVLDELRTNRAVLDRDPERLYALVREQIRPHFDLEHTAQVIVGPAWPQAAAEERNGFVEAFERYLVSSYARALLFVEPATLTVLGPMQRIDERHAMLPMQVVMDDGARFEAEVHFRLADGAWRIWDVRASGISFARQYRGDFGTEARIRGLARCAESLQQIADRNERELREQLARTGSIRKAR